MATHCIPCLSQEAKQLKSQNNKKAKTMKPTELKKKKKTDNPIQKRADVLNRQFSEEDKHLVVSTGREAQHH
jgi:hypothetical protein